MCRMDWEVKTSDEYVDFFGKLDAKRNIIEYLAQSCVCESLKYENYNDAFISNTFISTIYPNSYGTRTHSFHGSHKTL